MVMQILYFICKMGLVYAKKASDKKNKEVKPLYVNFKSGRFCICSARRNSRYIKLRIHTLPGRSTRRVRMSFK